MRQPKGAGVASSYRADIDGLRCVAVCVVVLFHAGVMRFSGGYVGVDVFFVISGYLITGILLREMDGGTYSFRRFLERRVRRILPATLTVVLVTLGLALWVLTPPDARKVGEASLATALSVANLYFYHSQDYFSADSGSLPLLHMWSLGVEEQFYLLLPPALLALVKYGRRHLRAVLVVATFVSLLAYAWGIYYYPAAAFYLLPFRAWELGLGANLAVWLGEHRPSARPSPLAQVSGLAGLGLIAGAVLVGDAAAVVPGLAVYPACLGAALVIAGNGSATLASRLLALEPVRFVGKISFSLYLWHWPVLVFSRLTVPSVAPARWMMLVAMFVLACLSWRFIEQPFRTRHIRSSFLSGSVALATAVVLAASALLILTSGLPQRFGPRAAELASYLDYDPSASYQEGRCFVTDRSTADIDRAACLRAATGRRNVLVLGDSHAAHLWYGLSKEIPSVHFGQLTAASCRMTLSSLTARDRRCREAASLAYHDVLATRRFQIVILSGAWKAEEVPDVAATLAWLRRRSIPVVLMGRGVTYREDLPRLLAIADTRDAPQLVDTYRIKRTAAIDRALADVARGEGASFIALSPLECPRSGCITQVSDGVPLKFDRGHLTAQGSRWLVRRLVVEGDLRKILTAEGPHGGF